MKTLSVVIVNWNHQTLLLHLLNSIFEHPPQADFEVVVIDNASADGSQAMVAANFPAVTLLVNSSNVGFAKAVNRVIRETSSQYVLLLNTDLVVLDGAIDTQIAFMESNPDCAISGGLLLNDAGERTTSYGRFPSASTLMAEVLPSWVGLAARNSIACTPPLNETQFIAVDVMTGADMMVRRSVIDDVGPLDEQFFMYFEDADWCLRIQRLGRDVCYVPTVHYIHLETRSAISYSSHRQQWLSSLLLYLRKHYHGARFAVCWLLWQLLQVKFAIWAFRTRAAYRPIQSQVA